MKQEVILSIDLATKTGYAILENNVITEYGTKRFTSNHREEELYNWLYKIIREKHITGIIVEACYYDEQRPQAFKVLAGLHGVLRLVASRKELPPIIEYDAIKYRRILNISYNPRRTKSEYRERLKQLSVNFVKSYGYDTNTDDEADAITMLMYHAKTNKIPIKHPA